MERSKKVALGTRHRLMCLILQSRSPSCGVKQIYDGSFSGKLIIGKGVFAELLEKKGIETLDVEDI